MERGKTLFLKAALLLGAAGILAFCIFVLSDGLNEAEFQAIVIGIYISVIPFFIATYQGLKLLSYVEQNKAFSDLSVKALSSIKYCAFAVSIVFAALSPLLYEWADREDAPGLFAIGLLIIGTSFSIGVFAGILQKLFQNAVDLKSENDLTV